MKSLCNMTPALLMVCGVFQALASVARADDKPAPVLDNSTLSYAVCPIVYPVDQSPAERGYHYIFYGNAFFINNEGYLLTAAHVLSQLSETQPYILLRLPMAPPRLVPITLVAMDRGHDVALLRATPNPFTGKYQVRSLPLLLERPALAHAVEASALRPSRLKDPHSFDAFVEDRPSGEVLGYQFTSNDKGRTDTELVLFSHEVLLGDSGAPVVSSDSQAVVGLVEGQWLRPAGGSPASSRKQAAGVGAAVPIHYAIALLQQQGVAWHAFEASDKDSAASAASSDDSDLPVPLSLVAPPYPSQALLGGEVVLDAAIDAHGQLADIKVVRGGPLFLDKAISAAHTWSFLPARRNGEAVETRIGIAFQFDANVGPMSGKPAQAGGSPSIDDVGRATERGPVPIAMAKPPLVAVSGSEASVITSVQIDSEGHPGSIRVLRGDESLASSVTSAVSQWQFAPAKNAGGENVSSTFIAVVVFRAGVQPTRAKPSKTSVTP